MIIMPPPTLQFEINGVEHEVEFPHKNGRKNSKTVFDCVDYTGLISYISNLDIEVKEYFRRRKYSGFEEHFKLERLEACSLGNGTMLAYPKGLYGKITEIDEEWEDGLAETGKKFGTVVILSEECYNVKK